MYWTGNSANALLLKTVITKTGQAVDKNYQSRQLSSGDLGIRMAIDRAQIKELTPEQRATAQLVAQEMTQVLLRELGVDNSGELQPGIVVRVSSGHTIYFAIVVKHRGESMSLKRLVKDGRFAMSFAHIARVDVEEIPGRTGPSGYIFAALSGTGSDCTNDMWRSIVQILPQFEGDDALLKEIALADKNMGEVGTPAAKLIRSPRILEELVVHDTGDATRLWSSFQEDRDEFFASKIDDKTISNSEVLKTLVTDMRSGEKVFEAVLATMADTTWIKTQIEKLAKNQIERRHTVNGRLKIVKRNQCLCVRLLDLVGEDKLIDFVKEMVTRLNLRIETYSIIGRILVSEAAFWKLAETGYVEQSYIGKLEDVDQILDWIHRNDPGRVDVRCNIRCDMGCRAVQLGGLERINDLQLLQYLLGLFKVFEMRKEIQIRIDVLKGEDDIGSALAKRT